MIHLEKQKDKNLKLFAYGEKNVIEGVQVDGVDLIPNGNKKVNIDLSGKQDKTDNNLLTTSKQVTGAINEVNSIAKGAQQGISYSNYSAMITAFNALDDDAYNVGQSIYIVTLEVPDLWVSSIESSSSPYTYTTDEAFTTELQTNGYVQVGYYKLSALETGKVDLSDYYIKPASGIPKSDLSTDTQNTLTDADTAMRITMYGKDIMPTDERYFDFVLSSGGTTYAIKPKYQCEARNVSYLNGLTSHDTKVFSVLDSETLTSGNISVSTGDRVIWDSTDGVWKEYTEYPLFPSNLVIPYEHNGKPVTWFHNIFRGHLELTSVNIPKTITNIGQSMFLECKNLVSVTIPNEVTAIGLSAFDGCSSLTSVKIPDSVTSIGNSAFSKCSSLIEITIPEGVTSIGYRTFLQCANLKKVTVPDSVASIDAQAFYLANRITVYCSSGSYAETWCKTNNIPYVYSETSKNKVTSLSAQSTDNQYPTAKCVYDMVGDVETALIALRGGSAS